MMMLQSEFTGRSLFDFCATAGDIEAASRHLKQALDTSSPSVTKFHIRPPGLPPSSSTTLKLSTKSKSFKFSPEEEKQGLVPYIMATHSIVT